MTKCIIKAYLIVCTAATIILLTLLMIQPTKTVKNVELEERAYNDSVLVYEYQLTLETLMKKHPACADTFMHVMEKINTDGE